jgi:hypothetical protein
VKALNSSLSTSKEKKKKCTVPEEEAEAGGL